MPLFRVIIRCILLFVASANAAPLAFHQHFCPHFPCYTKHEICNKVVLIFLFQVQVWTAKLPAPAEFLSNFADTYTVDNGCVIMLQKPFHHLIIFAIYKWIFWQQKVHYFLCKIVFSFALIAWKLHTISVYWWVIPVCNELLYLDKNPINAELYEIYPPYEGHCKRIDG